MTIDLSNYPELEMSMKNGDHLQVSVEVMPFLDNEAEQGGGLNALPRVSHF